MHALWLDYHRSRSRDLRDRLILSYAPLVKYVAGRLASGLPAHVDQSDLVSYGLEGLIGAIEGYRLDVGAKFETYAIPRIRGAIWDALRKLDWVPRSTRAREKQLRGVIAELERKLGRAPKDEEIAAKMQISVEELDELLAELSRLAFVSLDAPLATEEDELNPAERLSDPDAPDPQAELAASDQREAIGEAIARLPEREKIVLTLYYYEELTLREIGEVLGVTESRVSQLHTKAILRLRSRLDLGD
jgi:RNA polymerase sigma factor FliA